MNEPTANIEHKVYTTLNTEGYHSSCPCGWTAYAPALYESAQACAEHEDYAKELASLGDAFARASRDEADREERA